MQCLNCGKFCKNVIATADGDENIKKVEGDCKKCGHVDLTKGSWSWEDFFGYGEEATP